MLGVIAVYILIGNDHIKAISINPFLDTREEIMAKHAGRQIMKKVFNMGSVFSTSEYGLKKLKTIHRKIVPPPEMIPNFADTF
jgi:hypothetical protein